MSYKSILVLAFGRGDAPAIEVGAWLAAEHGAITHVLPVYPDLAAELAATATAFGGMPAATFDAAEEFAAFAQASIEKDCSSSASAADIVLGDGDRAPRMILEPYDRSVWNGIEKACVLTDLVVVSGELLKFESERAMGLIEEVLMRQRLPLLIVRGSPERLTGRAVIAWNARIEAGRAVKAALPLLGGSSATTIITHRSDDVRPPPPDALTDYLDLHEVGSSDSAVVWGEDAGQAILAACLQREAGLLVAGAYGHSRLREFVLGGVTRALLWATDGPSLLMAH